MSPHRYTHPCPACGYPVSITARFCGNCGTTLADRRDRSAELRAAMSGVVHRLEARDSQVLPAMLVDAARALAITPVDPDARVVIIGELGRGTRALANLLASEDALETGPSQRGAAATLDRLDAHSGLRGKTTIEVAPPLAEGAQSTREGVIPALMRADVLVVGLSAAQLLSATERRLLRSLAQLTDAPIALVVGRMDAIETTEDLDDVKRRTNRFRSTFGRDAVVFLLESDDSANAVRAWVEGALAQATVRVDAAWEQRAGHVLSALAPTLTEDTEAPPPLATLDELTDGLSVAHSHARSHARAQLDDGLAKLKSALAARLADMSTEERVHEGASELAAALEALVRTAVDSWQTELAGALADVELTQASIQAGTHHDVAVSTLTEGAPRLAPRHPDQSVGLMAAAVGLSVGVLLLPVGGSGAIAMGVSLTAGSYAAARVLRGRRDDALREAHTDELDRWLREVGAQANDWLVDHIDSAHELMTARLAELHAHTLSHREAAAPAALQAAVAHLRDRLEASI